MVRGDLLQEPVDAIVNAANAHLAHGRLPTGAAVVTTAGSLPFKGVIHAVGPRYGEGEEEEKLFKALTEAWARARENGWDSVAFPAVSSGIFAVPLDVCAHAYLKAARACPLGDLRLCLRDQPVIDAVYTLLTGSSSNSALSAE